MSHISEHSQIDCKSKCSYCLMCNYTKEDILKRKLFIVRIENETNKFRVYNSYSVFREDTADDKVNSYHEVILDFMPQRFRVDLDIPEIHTYKSTDSDDIKKQNMRNIVSIIADMKHHLTEVFMQTYTVADNIEWCVTLTKRRKLQSKYVEDPDYAFAKDHLGIHITSKNYMAANQNESKLFMNAYCEDSENQIPHIIGFIDKNINKKIQNWRIVNFSKFNKRDRIKRLYSVDCEDAHCVITNQQDCTILPILQKNIITINKFGTMSATNTVDDFLQIGKLNIRIDKQKIMDEINARMSTIERESFHHPSFSVSNGFVYVNFLRIKSSFCDICNRVHDNENSLYYVIYGQKIKKHCMRAK